MTDQPITPAQLDALERVVDKVFANLNIDVEFTRHFIDRVNDERNRKQITIRELGELFAKEYKRWGGTIKHMPVDTQAVMKDLSSAINIPFVLNKDEKGKELVAKTVMRKKDFKTPNKELPVESFSGRTFGGRTSVGNWGSQVDKASKDAHQKAATERKKKSKITPDTLKDINKKLGNVKEEKHGAKTGSQVKGSEPTPTKRKPTKGGETPHPMRGRLVGEETVNEISDKKVKQYLKKARREMPRYVQQAQAGKRWAQENPDEAEYWDSYARDMGAKYGRRNKSVKRFRGRVEEEQVNEMWKQNIFSGQTTDGVRFTVDKLARKNPRYLVRYKNDDKAHFDDAMVYYDDFETVMNLTKQDFDTAVAGGELMRKGRRTAHNGAHQFITPDRSRVKEVAGADKTENFVYAFANKARRNGWDVYVSRMAFRGPHDYMLEFEKDDNAFEVIGNDGHWELFFGPNLSGRGKEFSNLEDAFQTAAVVVDKPMREQEMDQPPLDVPTPTPAEIAQKHGIELSMIEDQLQMGIKVEMEHTEDPFAAMEIALDHLNEMPNYYDELATIEPHHYTDESVMAAWESYRDLEEKLIDPREAILQKALNYLDRKVQAGGGRQSLGGYAFDVAREVNLRGLASAKELAQMYRDWKGDSVVTEGWMESNFYYLDEVVREEEDPCWDGYRQLGTKKKKGKEVPNCVPKKKK